MNAGISTRTPQQALAALLDRYAPQRLLVVGGAGSLLLPSGQRGDEDKGQQDLGVEFHPQGLGGLRHAEDEQRVDDELDEDHRPDVEPVRRRPLMQGIARQDAAEGEECNRRCRIGEHVHRLAHDVRQHRTGAGADGDQGRAAVMQRVGLGQEEVIVEEIGHHLRMDEQRGVELRRLGVGEQGQFLLQFGQQFVGRRGGGQGVALAVERLQEVSHAK